MNALNSSRRTLLKEAGLGIGLAAAAPLSAGMAHVARRSPTRQLMETDVLVVGGGPAGVGAAAT